MPETFTQRHASSSSSSSKAHALREGGPEWTCALRGVRVGASATWQPCDARQKTPAFEV